MKHPKGLYTDCAPGDQPMGTYRNARNLLAGKRSGANSNEEGFESLGSIGKQVLQTVAIEGDKLIVFFCSVGSTEGSGSGIGIYTKGVGLEIKLLSPKLNFQSKHYIDAVYLKNGHGELVVAWTDNNMPPRICNLDHVPFNLTGSFTPSNSSDIELLDLFPKFKAPNLGIETDTEFGGVLKSGVYYFTTAYELEDGMVTDWSGVYGPVPVVDDKSDEGFFSYDGCEPGTPTSKSLRVHATSIDTRFPFMHIAVVRKIGGLVETFRVKRVPITTDEYHFVYSGSELHENLLLGDVLVNNISFDKAKTLNLMDNHLFLGNLTAPSKIDYQKWANNIKVNWVYDDYISLDGVRGSHKDGVMLFDRKGFMPDEVYALYAAFKLKDGTYSDAFHIPGREAGDRTFWNSQIDASSTVAEDALLSDLIEDADFEYLTEDAGLGAETKFFHTRNTAHSDGKMGYWENHSEHYPQKEAYDVWDEDGDTGISLQGEEVRHHKMPSLHYLHSQQGEFEAVPGNPLTSTTPGLDTSEIQNTFSINSAITAADLIESASTSATNNMQSTTTIEGAGGDAGVFIGHMYGANETQWLQLSYQVSGSAFHSVEDPYGNTIHVNTKVVFYIRIYEGNTVAAEHVILSDYDDNTQIEYVDGGSYSSPTYIQCSSSLTAQESNINITLEQGQFLVVGTQAFVSNTPYTPDGGLTEVVNVDFTSSVSVNVLDVDPNYDFSQDQGTTFAKVLGLKFSDIHIPEHIKSQVQGIEFFYAERNEKNMTILGQSLLMHGSKEAVLAGDGDYTGTFGGNAIQSQGGIPDHNGDPKVDSDTFRFHSFDMLKYKPDLAPSHIKLEYKFKAERVMAKFPPGHQNEGNEVTVYNDGSNDATADTRKQYAATFNYIDSNVVGAPETWNASGLRQFRRVADVQYLPADVIVVADEIDNRYGEECITGTILCDEPLVTGNYDGTDLVMWSDSYDTNDESPPTGKTHRAYLANLCVHRLNVYESFIGQELISTNAFMPVVVGENNYIASKVYGGDVHLSMYGIRTTAPIRKYFDDALLHKTMNAFQTAKFLHYFPCYSVSNLGYRHEGISDNELVYPSTGGSLVAVDDKDLAHFLLRAADAPNTNWLGYNTDYNSVNNLNKIFPYNPYADFLSKFPHRIIKGQIQKVESETLSLRNFLSNDYYEMPKYHGEITDLQNQTGTLLVQHERTLYKTISQNTLQGDELSITLGSGDIFRMPPSELISTTEGYMGGTNPSASMICKLGYFFADASQGKVFLVSDTIDEISNKGMRNWFRDNLKFKLLELYPEMASTNQANAIAGIGFNVAYEEKYNRVLFSKRDFIPKEGIDIVENPENIEFLDLGTLVYQDGEFFIVEDSMINPEEFQETSGLSDELKQFIADNTTILVFPDDIQIPNDNTTEVL
jgi:hypothetical protein